MTIPRQLRIAETESVEPATDGAQNTSSGLRTRLFHVLDDMRAGKMGASEAKAVAAVAHQIIQTVHMEIEVAKMRADYPGDTKLILPPPLNLR